MREGPALSVDAEGADLVIAIDWDGARNAYRIVGGEPAAFRDFWDAVARDHGVRPLRRPAARPSGDQPPWRALLTENIDPRILHGYGDPAVLRTPEGWWLAATSNDAPDALPLLFSADGTRWEARGFVFPEGKPPPWTANGPGIGDYWAPEMARVGTEYWLTYTARAADSSLSIGLARAGHPGGPWRDNGAPLLRDAMIDSHLHVDEEGAPWLIWKQDNNSHWPRPLAALLKDHEGLIDRLFYADEDRRAAALCAALRPFAETRPPMQRFFLLQPMIRATVANWARVTEVLGDLPEAAAIRAAMVTPVFAQRLAEDGGALVGERHLLLVNDQPWEGHLIEGPFVTRQDGLHYLFYAGNDFTSPDYGIGYAVAERLTGPWRKAGAPLLRSQDDWIAPGHASVAEGPEGHPRLYFHAFRPGTGGYNVFRALLTVGLTFDRGRVTLRP